MLTVMLDAVTKSERDLAVPLRAAETVEDTSEDEPEPTQADVDAAAARRGPPDSADAALTAGICDHDRDLILQLLTWNAGKEIAWRHARDDGPLAGDDPDHVGVCEGELDQALQMTGPLRRPLRVTV